MLINRITPTAKLNFQVQPQLHEPDATDATYGHL